MDEDVLISITLYGELGYKKDWLEWYQYCKNIIIALEYEPNYISINSSSNKSNTILSLQKKEKRILTSISKDENIKWLSVYSLPDNFITAAFDYNILITRNNKYLSLVMSREAYSKLNINETLCELKEFIILKYGEIYEMHRDESPLLYASGLNEASVFNTLKIIKRLE